MYLSFTGGPTLGALERRHGARRVKPLYCGVDPELYMVQSGWSPAERLFEAAAGGRRS